MANQKESLIQRLIEGYEKAKKPIAYIIMILAVTVEALPEELLPESVRGITQTGVLLMLALILMEILFEIYEKVVKERSRVNIVNSNEIFTKIYNIVKNEKKVKIQYIGLAGRHGWQNVIEKMLNENTKESIINKVKFDIQIALLDPKVCEAEKEIYERFDMVGSISNQIKRKAQSLTEVINNDSKLTLYHYGYMPNMMGFLINENYLFLTNCYWETQRGELALRAGGTDYFIYDKNDAFGGQEFISRFSGWFQYIESLNKQKTPEISS